MATTPAWDDVRQFVNPADFGIPAVITFQAGGTRSVTVIFDDPYLNAERGEYQKDDSHPTAVAVAADFAGVKRKDTIVIDGKTYAILSSPQSDGTGCASLDLALGA